MLPRPSTERRRIHRAAKACRQAMWLLWPAFLMAGLLEILVFSVIDPGSLCLGGGELLRGSAQAVYSLAFVTFWAVIAAAGWIMLLLQQRATRTH